MNFIVSARTDIGLKKQTNQDSMSVRVVNTSQGRMVFALLCDGMGGLEKGEVASASVIMAFDRWLCQELPMLTSAPTMDPAALCTQWQNVIHEQNKTIKQYGVGASVSLGTTVVAMLLTQTHYYILNVGDSRAYEISDSLRLITADHTLVAREVSLGHITEQQAEKDPRRSVLLQCVGASEWVHPDFFSGAICANAVYMLCSDGFRHEITPDEIYSTLHPSRLLDEYMMNAQSEALIELNKARQEQDNISVLLVRTF